jgi:3-oxoacyl-[acyl-carrier protein] reductase
LECSRRGPNFLLQTGGVANMGEKIAQRLTREGAGVLGIDLNQSSNEETANSCKEGTSGSFVSLTGSVASEDVWRQALEQTQAHFGCLPDTVVNCAGYVHLGQDPHTVPETDFDRVWQVNVKPLFWTTKLLVPLWSQQGIPGHVLCIGSIGSQRPRPSTVWYTASKGAIDTV